MSGKTFHFSCQSLVIQQQTIPTVHKVQIKMHRKNLTSRKYNSTQLPHPVTCITFEAFQYSNCSCQSLNLAVAFKMAENALNFVPDLLYMLQFCFVNPFQKHVNKYVFNIGYIANVISINGCITFIFYRCLQLSVVKLAQ